MYTNRTIAMKIEQRWFTSNAQNSVGMGKIMGQENQGLLPWHTKEAGVSPGWTLPVMNTILRGEEREEGEGQGEEIVSRSRFLCCWRRIKNIWLV